MRRWLGTGAAADEEAQARALGVTLPSRAEDEPVEIPSDAAPAIDVFLRLGTQWRWADAGPVGLDYQAAAVVADWLGIAREPRLLDDLRWLEAGALDELAERSDRSATAVP